MFVNFDAVRKHIKRLGTVERKHFYSGIQALQDASRLRAVDGVKKVRSKDGLYELRPVRYTKIRIIFERVGDGLEVKDIWKKNGTNITRRYS